MNAIKNIIFGYKIRICLGFTILLLIIPFVSLNIFGGIDVIISIIVSAIIINSGIHKRVIDEISIDDDDL